MFVTAYFYNSDITHSDICNILLRFHYVCLRQTIMCSFDPKVYVPLLLYKILTLLKSFMILRIFYCLLFENLLYNNYFMNLIINDARRVMLVLDHSCEIDVLPKKKGNAT